MSMDTPPPPPSAATPSSGPGGATPALANPLVEYWKKVVLENYANFQGRARRAEFWWFTLVNIIAAVVLSILIQVSGIFWVLYAIYVIGLIVPSIAVAVRRLHDTDKSAWYLLIYLIPFVGWIVMIVFYATDSTRGTNQYGVSPKYPAG